MMNSLTERLGGELKSFASNARRRDLRTLEGIDFSSNDYLGLSDHPAVLDAVAQAARRGIPHGSTGSRLLSGNHPEHLDAENRFARFIDRERSLLFGSGFSANLALLSSLPGRHDLIVLDVDAHASLKEGARASLAAKRTFAHNDVDALALVLQDREAFRDVFVVVEGVYSMGGDRAPLAAIARVTRESASHLVVDEAHATGLYGARLRGITEAAAIAPPLATVHPCGKALGSSGAFVAADAVVIDYLVNTARPFLFSTAPAPLQAVALSAVTDLLPSAHDRVERVFSLSARLRERLSALRVWRLIESDSPIVPIIIGGDEEATRAAGLVRAEGFDVRPIRPPTVPGGTSRLRVSITWKRTEEEIDRLADSLKRAESIVTGGSR